MAAITPAASVLLSRGPGSRDIFAILRGRHLVFFGGFWAFPGGKLAPQDHESACDTDHEPSLTAFRTAACRELFEETGILIARHADGTLATPHARWNELRRALLDDQIHFKAILNEYRLHVHADDFRAIGSLTTPPFSALRFHTMFFQADLPANQQAEVWAGELEQGEWIGATALLDRWRRGECLLTPPTAMSLLALGDHPLADAPGLLGPRFARLADGILPPIWFAPDVQVIPLQTAALPPANHTNAFLVGAGPRYLIDPGPDDPSEQGRLFDLLDEQSISLQAILLSHHHRDHIGAALACAKRYRAPIWAHPITAEKLAGKLVVDHLLHEGDRIDLGPCPADGGDWHLSVLHTPGHAPGHLAFLDSRFGILLAGDMVSTMTSIVVGPPDGDLRVYLDSLHRLKNIHAKLLIPSHGNGSARPDEILATAIAHRAKRELQLVDALQEGAATVETLLARLYRGTPQPLLRFARAQLLAGLQKLKQEGRASTTGQTGAERWTMVKVDEPKVEGEGDESA